MKAPIFWQSQNITANILRPLGFLYNLGGILRRIISKPYKAPVPVICVGNLTVGGVGKTPVCIALSELLSKGISNIFFLTRGYKGKLKNISVSTTAHNADTVGDEAVLLSRYAPTIVNQNRALGAKFAVDNGAKLLIMDDGFQNPHLYKDFSFVVIDGSQGFGNGFVLPAGALRESISIGLKRANAVIIIGEDKHNLSKMIKKFNLPIIHARMILNKSAINNLIASKVIAFAGIGIPQKFFDSLKNSKLELKETIAFPDHHKYSENELEKLVSKAKSIGAALVTTEKDYVKIPNAFKPNIIPIPVKILWEDEHQVFEILSKIIK
ncbi:MAG: tetraacyldisaccharide 4'-kinase [Alphaproteobacteria bacterium]